MFQDINIEKELISLKSKNEKLLLNSANDQLNNDLIKEKTIQKNINSSNNKKYFANIKIDESSNVYNFKTIETIAIKHRLRFLPTKFFKNQIPQEAIFKIKEIEKSNSIEIKKFFILAPSSAFDLEDCNKDPLLFIPLKNNQYYLVHKWGSDLSWIKKLTAIPFRTLETMAISVALTALIIALLTPTWLILNGAEIDMGYFGYHRLAWFLYAFIMLCSLSTFICFSQSIYPSEYQWNKKTYN
ncbi:MAG: hypothetical protein CL827_00550 [Crocinitomicaceae bacterium]|nr:hypothetical protein [Crocinitomicaceae bacterium]